MATVILFGGGDGGGLIITARGVRRIPPFDPAIRNTLSGVSSLVGALRDQSGEEDARELAQLTNKVANLAVARVEAAVGELDAEHGLIYLDEDGGFTCGSTGRPPIPIPGPPQMLPALREMIAGGLVDAQLMNLVEAASARDIDATKVLEDPAGIAQEVGVTLSERAIEDLQRLAPSRRADFSDPVDAELVAYFHKVLDQPEHLQAWATRPHETSKAVGVELSEVAIDRLINVGVSARIGPGDVQNPVAVAVAVGIVIMLVDRPAEIEQLAIRDRSLNRKL